MDEKGKKKEKKKQLVSYLYQEENKPYTRHGIRLNQPRLA